MAFRLILLVGKTQRHLSWLKQLLVLTEVSHIVQASGPIFSFKT